MLIQFAISRQREFKADAVGAQISGRPGRSRTRYGSSTRRRIGFPMHVAPAVAPLAQGEPLALTGGGIASLFSTHSVEDERVEPAEALRALALWSRVGALR
jgi:heat shock protein HtpX